MAWLAPLTAVALLQGQPVSAASLSADEAGGHVGENATVCGTVASAHFSRGAANAPTFLDLDKPYPNTPFTLVIFGRDRAKFGTPEQTLLHQRLCATGIVKLYRGRPEMILEDPAQVQR
jgi:DNA/RNA endonuclease YhcR with UshA esterase domain